MLPFYQPLDLSNTSSGCFTDDMLFNHPTSAAMTCRSGPVTGEMLTSSILLPTLTMEQPTLDPDISLSNMFAKATKNFLRDIDAGGELISVSSLNDSDKAQLLSVVAKKKRFWCWQKPKYQLSSCACLLGDVLTEEVAVKPVSTANQSNKTKGGVDKMDKMIGEHSCKRQTKRWPVALFSNILDVSALNSYIVYCQTNPEFHANRKDKRRLFLTELCYQLLMHTMMERSSMICLSRQITEAMIRCGIRFLEHPEQREKKESAAIFVQQRRKENRSVSVLLANKMYARNIQPKK
ncbi:unnamed protein product [Ranitomeya imitator]|uniref:Gasdermin pore forming domain-containing protein n=1 Tax=Ranitomeya imitator TaxID=111125 RepID=A0ABN9KT80_9NEOB|nr:unnamed protein product [Ranitomeya imitator]